MTGSEIRESFLEFFRKQGHAIVPSSSLLPKEDPTLLFTNAGMVQFKNCFLGQEDRGYTRAATSQKCVRAGGKHNDLENVGFTARHHTFFEMLGNFSFGDYFKEEAIEWGWLYLTEVVGLPKEKLIITIYKDDDEAFDIWHEKMGIPADRIVRMGEKDNFWTMGETGPCGPCSEIIYDQGPGVGCGRPECDLECGCDRFLEIWNLVFTQFDRDAQGNLTPLPRKNIDTGMGLERLAAVIQGVESNYDTDLFAEIIEKIEEITGLSYHENDDVDVSIRVIADHARAVTFLISDGILPSNEGRGYVLRRILRRAARHGKLLGLNHAFLHRLVTVVIEKMKDAYPELLDKEPYVTKVVVNEEERFMDTLDAGMKILHDEVAVLRDRGETVIPGSVVFKLYDTFGFPVDLTEEAVHDMGLTVDMAGFDEAMEMQRAQARQSWKGSGEEEVEEIYRSLSRDGISTEFAGYGGTTDVTAHVTALIKEGRTVASLQTGDKGEVFVDRTSFYGEVGGQVGDVGVIEADEALFRVNDTQRPLDDLFSHGGEVERGEITVGDTVIMKTNRGIRHAIEANHSGTHILQAALKKVLGDHIKQSGSLVNAERLRFDFTHFAKVDDADLEEVERIANEYIRMNVPVETDVRSLDEALKMGATAVFDEKYGDTVRIVKMGDISMELCGGTHVSRSGDIGFLKIIGESSIAAGIRRIDAVTGTGAVKYVERIEREIKKAASLVKASPEELANRLERLLKHQKECEKEIDVLQGRLAARESANLLDAAKDMNGTKILATRVDVPDVKALRDFGDKVRDKMKSGVMLLGSVVGGKVMLLCMVTSDLTDRYHAGNIIKEVAPIVGGSGGGRPDMAQAGGSLPDKLDDALKHLEMIIAG